VAPPDVVKDPDPLKEEGLTGAAARDVGIVAKGGAVQIAGQYSQQLLSMAFIFVAIRVIGKAAYGVYRQVLQVLAIAAQVGLAGFNYASMRYITKARASGDPGGVMGSARIGLTATAMASGAVYVALVVAAEPLANLFADNAKDAADMAHYLRIGAPYVPLFALMQTLRYCTQAYKTMVPSVIVGNIVQPAARFLIGVVILATSATIAGLTVGLVISTGIGTLLGAYYLRRMLTDEERAATPRGDARGMVKFAIPQLGASLFGVQTLGLGIIVLGLYSGDVQVALFAVALSLQSPGTVFLGGIVNIWAPMVSDLHEKGEIARLGSLYQTINRWVATFSFPIFAAVIIEHDLWSRLLSGSARAGSIAALLAIGNLVYVATGPTGYVISMTGRPGVNFVNSVVAVALYWGFGMWAASEHGAVGLAIVDSGVTILINVVRVFEAWILVGIQPFGRTFVKPVVATAAGAGVLLASRPVTGDNTLLELAGVAIAALVYFGVLRVLGVDPEEKLVWDRIKKRAFKGRGKARQ
jgi:O-antigen/teichoic acid export membrane protein